MHLGHRLVRGRLWPWLDRGKVPLFLDGRAQPGVQQPRSGHLVAQELSRALAGDPVDDLAHQVAVRVAVIGMRGSGLPVRCGGGQAPRDLVVLVEAVAVEVEQLGVAGKLGGAGRVAQQHANRRVFLAVGGVFGPVVAHLGVEVEFAAIDEDHGRRRGDRLAGGLHVDASVANPGAVMVRHPGPQVDDDFAVVGGGESGAAGAHEAGVVGEGVPDRFQSGLDVAVDGRGLLAPGGPRGCSARIRGRLRVRRECHAARGRKGRRSQEGSPVHVGFSCQEASIREFAGIVSPSQRGRTPREIWSRWRSFCPNRPY